MIRKLAKNDVGKVIISIILGLGISALFRKVCNDRDCLVIQGPPIEEVENNIHSFDGKCYKYKAKSTSCNKKD
jgi:hypothetical protein